VDHRILSLVLVTTCFQPATVAAEGFVSPYIGLRFASDTTFRGEDVDRNKATFGAAVGLLTAGVIGVEADVGFVPGFFQRGLRGSGSVMTLMGNVIVATPLGIAQYGLRPYFVGGVGLLHARVASATLETDNSSLFGMNLGGGAIGPLTPRTSVRFDIRYFRNLSHDEESQDFLDLAGNPANLGFWRGTVGLSFRF
jgi:hypothetical protein